MSERKKTFYLCGAGGKGNAGAEAILLAIVKLLQGRYPGAEFFVSSWYPERIAAVLRPLPGRFVCVRHETLLANPVPLARADAFVVCGDVSISETVVTHLPLYYALRTLAPRLLGKRVVFLGIEAEGIRMWFNRLAVAALMNRTVDYHVLRNEYSVANLRNLGVRETSLLLGCEPSLMLTPADLDGFSCRPPPMPESRLVVGFGVRDFFSRPLAFRLTPMRLERRDVPPGEVTAAQRDLMRLTAAIADHLAETHNARIVFMPHHYLPPGLRVILPDSEIAARIVAQMRRPGAAVVLEDALHPFELIRFYQRLDLAVSMRYHTNAFAFLNAVPTLAYRIAPKMANFLDHARRPDLLIDPWALDADGAKARIDAAVRDHAAIAANLRAALGPLRQDMNRALDIAFEGI